MSSLMSKIRKFNSERTRPKGAQECINGLTWIDISNQTSFVVSGEAVGYIHTYREYTQNFFGSWSETDNVRFQNYTIQWYKNRKSSPKIDVVV